MKILATKQITQKTLLFALTAIIALSAIAQVSAQVTNSPAIDIKDFSFTPSTIDVTSSSATVTVTIRVTDTERDVIGISMNFRSPLREQIVYVYLDSGNRISGNARDGVYSKAVIFPQYSAAGTWKVNYISVNDSGRNNRGFFTTELAARGFATDLQVISNNQDIIAPEISDFSFTPSSIDTTKGSQQVTITFRVTDATSGVRYIEVDFFRPEDNYYDGEGFAISLTSANRISGDNKDGVYRAVFIVPQNTPLGIYDVEFFAADGVNLYTGLNAAQLAARGYPSQLRIRAGKTTPFDFDGDGKADISVFRPSNRTWYFQQSANGFTGLQFGDSTDKLVPADYDGDGKTDFAVFRPSNSTWYLLRSQAGFSAAQFGTTGDIPVATDYDNDGKDDIAVFRPSSGTWFMLGSTAGFSAVQFGMQSDVPVPGVFDGDGRADQVVFRPSDGVWYLNRSQAGFSATQLGSLGDVPTAGDFDGDGRRDIAVYRPSDGVWYRLNSSNNQFFAVQFGTMGDIPVPADYDGDGRTDEAVFRPENDSWYLRQSTAGFSAVQFGTNGDRPAPAAQQP